MANAGNFASFRSGGISPGTIAKDDAAQASDIAQLVNSKANSKFPTTNGLEMPDVPESELRNAPGEVVGRGENAIRRETPFGDPNAVKVAARLFKLALFDINVAEINKPNEFQSTKPVEPPKSLEKVLGKSLRLGDYADGRPPHGVIGMALKVSSAPESPIVDGPDDTQDDFEITEAPDRSTNVTGTALQQVLRKSLKPKIGTFVGYFLRESYERK